MDPVKKTFSESFADFELPVREELWQQVRHKRRAPARRVLPLYRIAAAAAVALLLGAAWFLWPESGKEPAMGQLAERKTAMHSGQTEGVIRSARTASPVASAEASESGVAAPVPVKPSLSEAERKATVIALQSESPVPSPPVLEEDAPQEELAWVHLPEEALVQGPGQALVPDALPMPRDPVLEDAPEPVAPRQPGVRPEGMDSRRRTLLPAVLKPILSDPEKTGPERLLAALETYRPRVVDDLLALGSRQTEIEITW